MFKSLLTTSLLAFSLPVMAAGDAPITQGVLKRGQTARTVVDIKLGQLNAPASIKAMPGKIHEDAQRQLSNAEKRGEEMNIKVNSGSVEAQSGKSSYQATQIGGLDGLSVLKGTGRTVSVSGSQIYTEKNHMVNPQVSDSVYFRQRTLTPVEGQPGSFHVKSHTDTFGDQSKAKDREYVIKTK